MSADKRKRTLSPEEMRAYLNGEVKGRAANDLEKHLLNDPFDQEAMEGFEQISRAEMDADLSALAERLQPRKRRRFGYLIPLAATVSLLVVAIIAMWLVLEPGRPTNEISLKTESQRDQEKVREKNDKVAEMSEELTELPEPRPVPEEIAFAKSPQKAAPEPRHEERSREPVMTEAADEDDEMVMTELTELPAAHNFVLSEPDSDKAKPLALESVLEDRVAGIDVSKEKTVSKKELATSRQPVARDSITSFAVSGRVVDEEGSPLPGASVVITGTSRGTVTDRNGYYELDIPEGDSLINFSYVGMKSRQKTVSPSTPEMDVSLESDLQSLSEVVVVGYGASSKSSLTGSVSRVKGKAYKKSRPKGGHSGLKKYLHENLRYPESALTNGIEGTVILSVQILANGEIGTIEVKKGLGYGCDEEAIRLIKAGPDWQPARSHGQPVTSSVRIKVKFALHP